MRFGPGPVETLPRNPHFGAAIHFDADLVEILRARADTYERLGQFDKAQADREQALRLDMSSDED